MNISSKALKVGGVCCLLGATITSCIDDNYDLSDIDKTVRVDVNQLIVPINIDAIKLDNIIDIKEGDRLQIYDGQYCVIENGEFNSSDITINPVSLAAPTVAPTHTEIFLPQRSKGLSAPSEISYHLQSQPTSYDYQGDGNEYVVDIESIFGNVTFDVDIKFAGLEDIVTGFDISDLKLQMPKGLTLTTNQKSTYDPETGVLGFDTFRATGMGAELKISVSAIDFKAMGGVYSNGKASISGELSVLDGYLEIGVSDLKPGLTVADIPSSLVMDTEYTMSPIDIKLFNGQIKYSIEDVNISDVDLSDLPDVLTGEGTTIVLGNPQLYLSVTNPLHKYDLYARTGLTITSHPRYSGGETRRSSLDNGYFTISGTGASNEMQFCLSPEEPAKPYEGYEGCTHVAFSSLKDVLDCKNGLPISLGVELDDPVVPVQSVSNFELGVNLNAVHGRYTFVAPLQLGAGSQVCYSDVLDGWSSEDLDKMTIETIEVNLIVDSDLPVSANLTGYPIDVNGNQINGVNIEGATIPANAKKHQLKLRTTGSITRLDGISFKAVVNTEGMDAPLNPNMTIKLSNVRPCVSGYYQTEL